VEAAAGQHAQELDEAMKNLTLHWIMKTFVRLHASASFTAIFVSGCWMHLLKCMFCMNRDVEPAAGFKVHSKQVWATLAVIAM